MDKRTCGSCAYRGSDGYCPCQDMVVTEHERCYNYLGKGSFSLLAICMLWLLAMAAIAFVCTMVAGCSQNEKPMPSEIVVLEVSDRPAPEWTQHVAEPEEDEDELLLEEEEPVVETYHVSYYPATTSEGVLTKSGGVNSYNGKTETWYSSNVLRHYRIEEWECGDDGVWRDSDGYVIIASSEMPQGATHETSLGIAKVYDSGCAPGVVDVYVAW